MGWCAAISALPGSRVIELTAADGVEIVLYSLYRSGTFKMRGSRR